ncbi:hypothetical protein [Gardnerella sp. Marseille-Q2328]|nr:hypothetical protein [Gardnerella sp. Marseille-Q2328]
MTGRFLLNVSLRSAPNVRDDLLERSIVRAKATRSAELAKG